MSSSSLCLLPALHSSGKKVVQGDSRIWGLPHHCRQESLLLTDLPELPVSPRSASGSNGKAAVGSWLHRAQVKQAGAWRDGGAGMSQVCLQSQGEGGSRKDGRLCCLVDEGGQRVYVSSRWAGKGRAVRGGRIYMLVCLTRRNRASHPREHCD